MTSMRPIAPATLTEVGTRHGNRAKLAAPLLATTALVTVLAVLPCRSVHAATIVWTGTGSNDWATAGNWASNSVPTAADVAQIADTSINSTVIGTGVNGVAAQIEVGTATAGALTISGGSLTTDSGKVGLGAGGGTVTVTGAGSTWYSNTTLSVGESGPGVLEILNGGSVQTGSGMVGVKVNAGTIGGVLVDGAGSQWLMSNDLDVGLQGQGLLKVSGGGAVSVSGAAYVGIFAGGAGVVTVTGAGSTFSAAGGLIVSQNGPGLFQVLAGGTATSLGSNIGANAGSVGIALVDGAGSSWTTSAILFIGDTGQGTLTVSNGGSVTTGTAITGYNATGIGSLIVTDPGSQLNSSKVGVGQDGHGSLTIANGGSVNNSDSYIGQNATGNGSANVIGSGSTWTMTGNLMVGDDGHGDLTIAAGGTVVNAHVGAIGNGVTGSGTVTVTGPGSTWQLGSILAVGPRGSGVLTVADGAVVSATGIAVASTVGSTGTVNIGAPTGAPAADPGSLNTGLVAFGLGTGSLNFNHTGAAYTFGAALFSFNATAAVNQLSGTTILTADNSGFVGTTTVSGGKLVVNNKLGGTVNVTGGTLGGSGTLGTVTVGAGGTIAPGNSIGTLNVANLTVNAGSTYTVELKAGGNTAGTHNDLINATGTVTINGGTVHVTPENGTDTGTTYTPKTTYTIMTAAGGVTGTFAALTDDYAFLDFALSYDANNVFLTSRLAATTFCLPGMTANQCATGNGAFSVGSGTMFDALVNLSAAQAPGALDQLSGEIHASARTAQIEDSRFAREAALNRLRLALGSVGGSKQGMAEKQVSDSLAFWGQGFGSWGSFGGNDNAATIDRKIGGFFMGGDASVSDNMRLGLMGGYQASSFDVDARTSSGKAETYTLGGYGGGQWGALGLRFGGAYGWSHIGTSRNVAFAGFSDNLSASYDARLGQLYGEAGYQINAGKARFEPFANLAYVNLSTGGFTESGGAAALTTAAQASDTAFTTLGIRAETAVSLGGATGTVHGMAGWRHAFGDVTPSAAHIFAAGGNAFTVAGVPIARNAVALDTGFDVNVSPNATLGLAYSGQFASGLTDQGIRGSFNVRF